MRAAARGFPASVADVEPLFDPAPRRWRQHESGARQYGDPGAPFASSQEVPPCMRAGPVRRARAVPPRYGAPWSATHPGRAYLAVVVAALAPGTASLSAAPARRTPARRLSPEGPIFDRRSRVRIAAAAAPATVAGGLTTHAARAQGYTFRPIVVPGASGTEARGIKAAGQIVGGYATATGESGFLDDHSAFTDIAPPGGHNVFAFGITDAAQIVSIADSSSTGGFYSFVDAAGVRTSIDKPGGDGGAAYAINDGGQVVGNYTGFATTLPFTGFVADPVTTPEPATLVLVAAALGTSAVAVRRRAPSERIAATLAPSPTSGDASAGRTVCRVFRGQITPRA
ncbi:hypothetical protein tb265_46070 [Gemmatimonadetes bacterium T265]|nr:hypothetical protein tb265_46070 [Gemmatimonadetes bacterium T265]